MASMLRCSSVYDLLGVMFYESGCKGSAKNQFTNAVGLIQFMPSTLRGLNCPISLENFQTLSAEAQMPWVRKYMLNYAPLPTMAHVYCAVFLPAELPHANDPDYVLAARDSKRSLVFQQNANFDQNGDGRITVSELSQAVVRNCVGPRWTEIVKRCGEPWVAPVAAGDSVLWLQQSLNKLGYKAGAEDGVWGNLTRAAVMIFQARNKLTIDGIPGKHTKAKLKELL